MSFALLSPAAGAALLALVAAAVALLYRLRPPPRRLAVSSLLLWRAAMRKRSPLERLRWWLSLLLAAAVALLLALATLGLQLGGGGEPLLLVVDTSPTMATGLADGRTRLDRARDEAGALLDRLGGGARVRVADTCGAPGEPGSPAAARRALAALAPCPERRAELPAPIGGERTVLVSDGVADLEPPDAAGEIGVFEPAANAGITALEIAGTPAEGTRAVVELVNGSLGAVEAELTIRAGEWRSGEALPLSAGEAVALVRELPAGLAGLVEVRVTAPGDALAADDIAFGWIGPPRWRLFAEGEAAPHLALALSLDPRVEWVGSAAEADAVVVTGGDAPPDRPALVVAAAGAPADPVPHLVDAWSADHPLFRGAPPSDAAVRPLAGPAEPDLDVVASAGGAPVVLARRAPIPRVRLAFALEDTGWTRHPEFPVFLGNALELLLGPAALEARPGDVVVPVAGAEVHAPDGSPVATRPAPGGTAFRADREGAWLARAGGRAIPVLVSVRDRGVSLVNRSRFRDGAAPALPTVAARGALDLPPLLLVAAAALLAFEWWSWRRRMTV